MNHKESIVIEEYDGKKLSAKYCPERSVLQFQKGDKLRLPEGNSTCILKLKEWKPGSIQYTFRTHSAKRDKQSQESWHVKAVARTNELEVANQMLKEVREVEIN